jgi:hypothetical protein
MGVLHHKNQKFIYGEVNIGATTQIVILAVDPPKNFVNHRAWWEADYDPDGQTGVPDCSSLDGVRPQPGQEKQQAELCGKCPQSEKGSAKSGKGSACSQSKQLLFVWPDDVEGRLNRFKVPASSLRNLCDYIYDISSALGAPIASVVTGIRFDKESDWSQPEFFFEKFLPEKAMSFTCNLAASPGVLRLSGVVEVPQIENKTAPKAPAAIEPPPVTPEPSEEEPGFIDNLFNKSEETTEVVLPEETPPADDPWSAINKREYLPNLLDALRKKGPEHSEERITAFIHKANTLNDEPYDPEKHGTSKDGYPALCKDGSFTKRKKQTKKSAESDVPDDVLAALQDV